MTRRTINMLIAADIILVTLASGMIIRMGIHLDAVLPMMFLVLYIINNVIMKNVYFKRYYKMLINKTKIINELNLNARKDAVIEADNKMKDSPTGLKTVFERGYRYGVLNTIKRIVSGI
jgi:hypothetical protein